MTITNHHANYYARELTSVVLPTAQVKWALSGADLRRQRLLHRDLLSESGGACAGVYPTGTKYPPSHGTSHGASCRASFRRGLEDAGNHVRRDDTRGDPGGTGVKGTCKFRRALPQTSHGDGPRRHDHPGQAPTAASRNTVSQ